MLANNNMKYKSDIKQQDKVMWHKVHPSGHIREQKSNIASISLNKNKPAGHGREMSWSRVVSEKWSNLF